MNTIVLYDDSVDIPDGIGDLAGFRRWVHSDDFPRRDTSVSSMAECGST